MQDHSKLKLNSNTVFWRLEWLKHTYQYHIIEISLPFVTRLWISSANIAFFEFWCDTLQNNSYFALLGSELQRNTAKQPIDRASQHK